MTKSRVQNRPRSPQIRGEGLRPGRANGDRQLWSKSDQDIVETLACDFSGRAPLALFWLWGHSPGGLPRAGQGGLIEASSADGPAL